MAALPHRRGARVVTASAYVGFIAFYALCVLVTWWVYLRSPARTAGAV